MSDTRNGSIGTGERDSHHTMETRTTMTAITRVEDVPALERPECTALAEAETGRMVALLRSLEPHDWARPTDCPGWDVRALAGHVLGMTETFAGLRPFVQNMRAGGKAAGSGPFIDGLTAAQVRRNAGVSADDLVRRMEALGPQQAKWRARRRLMRHIPLKQQMREGEETWRMGYLVDVILTRDTWMHRVDVARAAGRPLELSAAHDGRIVADVVAEWARRHGRPFVLELSGPAGGTFTGGGGAGGEAGGERIEVEAVEFCRILSGRAPGNGLLAQEVPF